MRKRFVAKKRRKKHGAEMEEQKLTTAPGRKPSGANGAFYRSGPMVIMPGVSAQPAGGSGRKRGQGSTAVDEKMAALVSSLRAAPPATLQVSGKGEPSQDSARGSTVRLEGRTDADFDGGSFETQNVRVSAGEGCDACANGDPCIRARGVLVARYHVTTTVTLPSASDFPELTPCQRARVQQAIDTVLAPHEQEHVRAFRRYNGVTRTPFDVVLCRSDFDSTIQSMFDSQESARRADAQGASDRLDPFHFDVDIDCEEPPEEDAASVKGPADSDPTSRSQEEPAPGPAQQERAEW